MNYQYIYIVWIYISTLCTLHFTLYNLVIEYSTETKALRKSKLSLFRIRSLDLDIDPVMLGKPQKKNYVIFFNRQSTKAYSPHPPSA